MKKISSILIFIAATTANSGVYKWTDEKGNVHFGDRPANQKKVTELIYDTESRAGITNSSGNNKERARMAKELETDRKEREGNREKRRIAKKKKQKKCSKSKKNLNFYQQTNRIYKYQENGERIYYSDKDREVKINKYKKQVAKYCR
ncbi:hypothetical protein MNBD_GAMMA06-1507 [hydrothermal vent metagenome]|uniref:DUF4124 domain-containing protein n=1 Tax=hydrothermal vent metagenome TaxID=652676 RepID=A0A3B0WW06_9ZZZZ